MTNYEATNPGALTADEQRELLEHICACQTAYFNAGTSPWPARASRTLEESHKLLVNYVNNLLMVRAAKGKQNHQAYFVVAELAAMHDRFGERVTELLKQGYTLRGDLQYYDGSNNRWMAQVLVRDKKLDELLEARHPLRDVDPAKKTGPQEHQLTS